MSLYVEQGQTPKPTNEITPVVESATEHYQRVYGALLQDVFTAHQALYVGSPPTLEALQEWSGHAHAIVESYGDIAYSMGVQTVDVTIPHDVPGERLYHLLLDTALQPRPILDGIEASLAADPTGAAWMRQRQLQEDARSEPKATSLSGTNRAIIRATELF